MGIYGYFLIFRLESNTIVPAYTLYTNISISFLNTFIFYHTPLIFVNPLSFNNHNSQSAKPHEASSDYFLHHNCTQYLHLSYYFQ